MTLTLNLQTQRSAGALSLNLAPPGDSRIAVIAGRGISRGLIRAGRTLTAILAGRGTCRGAIATAYDPNLLSAAHQASRHCWQDAAAQPQALSSPFTPRGAALWPGIADRWQAAESQAQSTLSPWDSATRLQTAADTHWQAADLRAQSALSPWDSATRLQTAADTHWQAADLRAQSTQAPWQPTLPLLALSTAAPWDEAEALRHWLEIAASDGDVLTGPVAAQWQQAGLAFNAWQPPRPPRPKPHIPSPPLELDLRHWRQPGPLILNLGASRPRVRIPDLRVYRVLNECSVVRLPDLTPLPVTSVSVAIDADSWAWSIRLTLKGADGWALCQPVDGYPREVQIDINGLTWTGMLDDPQLARTFGSHAITVNGLSRSGWLDMPWATSTTVSYDAPRTAQQIAEDAVDGTGWTLDWQLPLDPQWLIPAHHYTRAGTPIERLKTLVAAVKGSLYSDPADYTLIAYPRYPFLPWQWDASPIDLALPEAAFLSWNQSGKNYPPVNRVYVSGTTAGVLLQLTRDGTAGDLCASEPIVDSLLTDAHAARARAEAELAGGGPGFEATVQTLIGGEESFPLVRPGLLVEFAGVRGVSRSCEITATRTDSGLAVWQTIGIDRRTGPWL